MESDEGFLREKSAHQCGCSLTYVGITTLGFQVVLSTTILVGFPLPLYLAQQPATLPLFLCNRGPSKFHAWVQCHVYSCPRTTLKDELNNNIIYVQHIIILLLLRRVHPIMWWRFMPHVWKFRVLKILYKVIECENLGVSTFGEGSFWRPQS